jgi:eukaryotic-like serine/threonine-protein kinase
MPLDDPPLPDPPEIGPYKVIDVLGEGGMGVVYLAEQAAPVRRRVALKLLKPGMDSRQVVARFESERQALAVMDHPNIAKVLDSGVTGDGRPYFVMELVHGTPITDYADTHRLSTTDRIHLFIDVCHAVLHAHHKGVIHRDLKPSNVLVTVQESGPQVKVIDFGIAKAVGIGLTDKTLVTRAGQMLGTPEYMSPEQAEMSGLDVDTRTDIYSLGVMLYELIVGVLPFDLGSKPDYAISHTIREQEIPRPSTRLTSLGNTLPTVARYRSTTPESLRKELRGDLDWIILKAMDKDRTRRYDTPKGLANDLRRHLGHEPIEARPPSTRDRMVKFVRRNRTPVTAAAVAIAAILVGAAAAVLGFVQAREAQYRAEQEAATAQQVTDFLVDLFEVSDPGEALGDTITARAVLDRGVEQIRGGLGGQPVVRARFMRTMGVVYRKLGLLREAASLLEDAVAIIETAPRADDVELALSLQHLGGVYRTLGRHEAAEDVLLRALAIEERSGRPESVLLAAILSDLGVVYMVTGRYTESEPLLRRALSLRERLLGASHPEVGRAATNLGLLHYYTGQLQEARPPLIRAAGILERTYGPSHPDVGQILGNLGAIYYREGRYDEAEAEYSRALEIFQTSLSPEHPLVARVINNLGEVYWVRGDYEKAEEYLLRSLAIKEATGGLDHPDVFTTAKALANVFRDTGRYTEAEANYRRALRIREATVGPIDANLAEVQTEYAKLLRLLGRDEEAESMERRAANIKARASDQAEAHSERHDVRIDVDDASAAVHQDTVTITLARGGRLRERP